MFKILLSIFLVAFTHLSLYCKATSIVQEKAEPFVFVIFGATGDLTSRKLIPAIYQLAYEGHLSPNTAVVGFARRNKTDEDFRQQMGEAMDRYARAKPKESHFWKEFERKIFYHVSDFQNDQGYESLREQLTQIDQTLGTKGNRIFFLAVPPSYFPVVIEKLHAHHLLETSAANAGGWSRVILEKPFGLDLDSAAALQMHLGRYLDESQIYRLDHYLGKEGVQNLLTLRFENGLFEPLWNHHYIDYVQITLAEEMGIGTRANFWEETGLLRDVVQNHILQLLALVAMEQPASLEPEAIQAEKLKVLDALRSIPIEAIDNYMIRGQYGAGIIKDVAVPGYREELGVPASSSVETFIAAKLLVDNPRWEGIPFYIRAGKRLAKQTTEILIAFKPAPNLRGETNALLIRIQPHPGIFLKTLAKVPGLTRELMPVVFGYKLERVFHKPSPEAYERLIFDCAKGDRSLFVNGEEQLAAWRLLTPILNYWQEHPPCDFPNYRAGSWGPEAADHLLEKGHEWLELELKGEHENTK